MGYIHHQRIVSPLLRHLLTAREIVSRKRRILKRIALRLELLQRNMATLRVLSVEQEDIPVFVAHGRGVVACYQFRTASDAKVVGEQWCVVGGVEGIDRRDERGCLGLDRPGNRVFRIRKERRQVTRTAIRNKKIAPRLLTLFDRGKSKQWPWKARPASTFTCLAWQPPARQPHVPGAPGKSLAQNKCKPIRMFEVSSQSYVDTSRALRYGQPKYTRSSPPFEEVESQPQKDKKDIRTFQI